MSRGYILAFIIGFIIAFIAIGLIIYGIWTKSDVASIAGLTIGGIGATIGAGGLGADRTRDDRPSSTDSGRVRAVVKRLEETSGRIERVENDLDSRSVEAHDAATRIRKLAEEARVRKESKSGS